MARRRNADERARRAARGSDLDRWKTEAFRAGQLLVPEVLFPADHGEPVPTCRPYQYDMRSGRPISWEATWRPCSAAGMYATLNAHGKWVELHLMGAGRGYARSTWFVPTEAGREEVRAVWPTVTDDMIVVHELDGRDGTVWADPAVQQVVREWCGSARPNPSPDERYRRAATGRGGDPEVEARRAGHLIPPDENSYYTLAGGLKAGWGTDGVKFFGGRVVATVQHDPHAAWDPQRVSYRFSLFEGFPLAGRFVQNYGTVTVPQLADPWWYTPELQEHLRVLEPHPRLRRQNPDADLRDLERRARAGDPEAFAAWRLGLERAGIAWPMIQLPSRARPRAATTVWHTARAGRKKIRLGIFADGGVYPVRGGPPDWSDHWTIRGYAPSGGGSQIPAAYGDGVKVVFYARWRDRHVYLYQWHDGRLTLEVPPIYRPGQPEERWIQIPLAWIEPVAKRPRRRPSASRATMGA